MPASLTVALHSDPAGIVEVPGLARTMVAIHIGRPVYVACRRGGETHRGLGVHGDIDIMPARTPSRWEMERQDTALLLGLAPALVRHIAEHSGYDPDHVLIRNRFQIRDLQLEHIGWALKSEMEAGHPNGTLYLDGMAAALASHLLHRHSSMAGTDARKGGLSGRKLRQVLAYVEENLGSALTLLDIAAVAGLSASHLKTLFREATGRPVHQYVIERRVERARALLTLGQLSISQVALETGFAHPSHLARHVRRLLGASPKDIRDRL